MRNQLSERARNRTLSFSAERMGKGYLALYQRLLSERSQAIGEDFSKSAPNGESELP